MCCKKLETLDELKDQIRKDRIHIKEYMELINNVDERKKAFTGTAFVTFKNQEEYDTYLGYYPNSVIKKCFRYVQVIFANFLCCCCVSKNTRRFLKKSLSFTVTPAPEPTDVIWENLEYTYWNRVFRQICVYIISFILMGISFGVVLFFNWIQVYNYLISIALLQKSNKRF
jgi:hypothetical protein